MEEVLDAGKLLHTFEIAIKKSKDQLTGSEIQRETEVNGVRRQKPENLKATTEARAKQNAEEKRKRGTD